MYLRRTGNFANNIYFLRISLTLTSIYILIIQKQYKIRVSIAFWLKIDETEPQKYMRNNRDLIFLVSSLLLEFYCIRNRFTKFIAYISSTLLFIVYRILMVF